jgi:hypothetical protein
LLSQGKLEAATWFIQLGYRRIGFSAAVFLSSEGVAKVIDPISSLDYYGLRLPDEARATIEEA